MIVSYAQYAEDVRLHRLFAAEPPGYYIDVGAGDPVHNSVTRHFANRGWTGINIEPLPSAHARLVADRPNDVNLNLGLSDHDGSLPFHEAPDRPEWSTFDTDHAAQLTAEGVRVQTRMVPVTTLKALCERHVLDRPIDLLKIDAENHELAVIQGADWSRFRPRVVVAETNGHERWAPFLIDAGYLHAAFDGINRYYLRPDLAPWAPRLAAPLDPAEFIPFAFLDRLRPLRVDDPHLNTLGPSALRLASRLQNLSRHHPRLSRLGRRLLRRASL